MPILRRLPVRVKPAGKRSCGVSTDQEVTAISCCFRPQKVGHRLNLSTDSSSEFSGFEPLRHASINGSMPRPSSSGPKALVGRGASSSTQQGYTVC